MTEVSPAPPVPTSRAVPLWAVISAGLAPVLLAGGWLVAGAHQPATYDPIRQTVSVLAGHAGTDRWIMTGALLLVGGCDLVTAAGLTGIRTSARILLTIAGLASIGIAVSPEPVTGSTPQHLAWTALGAVIITVWPAFVAQRAASGPPILSVCCSAAVTAVFVVLLGWLVIETQAGSVLGLAERLSSLVETSWPFIVALVLWRTRTSSPAAGTAQHAAATAARAVDHDQVRPGRPDSTRSQACASRSPRKLPAAGDGPDGTGRPGRRHGLPHQGLRAAGSRGSECSRSMIVVDCSGDPGRINHDHEAPPPD